MLVFATISSAFQTNTANAAQITTRSLKLVAGPTDGATLAGGIVKHEFAFTLPTGGNVGSIKFTYCTIATGSCTMPPGLVTTSAALDSEAGITGWTVNNTTNGAPYITRAAAPITAGDSATIRLATITNPSADNTSFFVRIASYASTDTTGSPIDTGSVTASTATLIELTGIMPESLIFCTGETITKTAGIPDCSTAGDGDISFNQLFSPSDTATATSQMAASTNAGSGYVITVNGGTLASGSNTIPAITAGGGAQGIRGTGQFGMNLVANTTLTSTIAAGANISDPSNTTDLRGKPLTGYDTVDYFKFVSGDAIANSGNSVLGPTNSQIYTTTYMVNVAGNQLAGTYTTTLTYICTPTF
jgi:hypothetical protein